MWDMPGTMCDRVASLGSHGRSKLPVCVYFSFFPYSKCMTSGRVVG